MAETKTPTNQLYGNTPPKTEEKKKKSGFKSGAELGKIVG